MSKYKDLFCAACHKPVDAATGEHVNCFFGNNSNLTSGYKKPICEADVLKINIASVDSVVKSALASRDKWVRRLANIEAEEKIKVNLAQKSWDSMVKP